MDRDAKVWRILCIVSPDISSLLPASAFTQNRLYQFFILMCSPCLVRKTKASGAALNKETGNRYPPASPCFSNPRAGLPLLSSTQVHRTLTRRFLKSRSESFSAVASQIHRLTYARNRTKVSDIGRSILSASSARSLASTYVRYTVSSVICLRGSLIPDSGSIVSHRC